MHCRKVVVCCVLVYVQIKWRLQSVTWFSCIAVLFKLNLFDVFWGEADLIGGIHQTVLHSSTRWNVIELDCHCTGQCTNVGRLVLSRGESVSLQTWVSICFVQVSMDFTLQHRRTICIWLTNHDGKCHLPWSLQTLWALDSVNVR